MASVTATQTGRPGFTNIPKRCTVTGGSGFVGQRLVEMLVERGAERVVSFDISPKPRGALEDPRIIYFQGDITKKEDVLRACEGSSDCVFHIAALVGPYHDQNAYEKVNYEGTLHVLNACRELKIPKLVMSSSPSTRFPYPDPNIEDKTEDELVVINGGDFAPQFLQAYAETKAKGEKAVRDACCDELMTVAVAPHQVYGPRDGLFLPSLLEAAGDGKLRVFGAGDNRISFCHVDNYAHGLILGAEALYKGSPALGKFYIVTDGPAKVFWRVLDSAVMRMGMPSLFGKMHLPVALMMIVAQLTMFLGHIMAFFTGTPYHIIMRSLKFTTFSVKMLVIHRSFNIQAATRDLKYEPVISFEDGWEQTLQWFTSNWLPTYRGSRGGAASKNK